MLDNLSTNEEKTRGSSNEVLHKDTENFTNGSSRQQGSLKEMAPKRIRVKTAEMHNEKGELGKLNTYEA